MDAEVRRIIVEAYKTTEKLLQDNKDKLITVCMIITYITSKKVFKISEIAFQ